MNPGHPTHVLATGSPRRRDLLDALGVRFTVRPVDVDETPRPGEAPRVYVERLARAKASERVETGELVLGADTIVVLDGDLLGKPADEAEARSMLALLAGREHTVLTGVALVLDGSEKAVVEESKVRIAGLSEEEIAWYAATGETLDKAGSYAVQGIGALFVEGVTGDYSNVVGLPLPATYRLFREMGHDLRAFRHDEGHSENHDGNHDGEGP
jgi:septum formation protein